MGVALEGADPASFEVVQLRSPSDADNRKDAGGDCVVLFDP